MIGTLRLKDVNEVQATLTVTTTIAEWKELRQQMAKDYPSWRLANLIGSLIDKATAAYEQDETKRP